MQVQARDLAGYTAKRVRAYENKSSSPKKHLGKLFEKTASAEPVETKQKNKKENRPKRKSTFMTTHRQANNVLTFWLVDNN